MSLCALPPLLAALIDFPASAIADLAAAMAAAIRHGFRDTKEHLNSRMDALLESIDDSNGELRNSVNKMKDEILESIARK